MTRTRLLPAPFLCALVLGCPAPEPAEGCPEPGGSGVNHAGPITADEVWRAEDGPHTIDEDLQILDGATLRIEACAEVRLAPGAGIEVGQLYGGVEGRLEAAGTEGRPVRLVRADTENPWDDLTLHAPATIDLKHTELVGGGGDETHRGATITAVGDWTLDGPGQLAVDHVTIDGSAGYGVWLEGSARFAAGSDALTVTGSGDAGRPYPVVMGPHALTDLPAGSYVGNAVDAIRVLDDLANDAVGLQRDATMHERGVPYVVGGDSGEGFWIGGSDGARAVLTVEPGVELRVRPGTGLRIRAFGEQPIGALVAEGTADAPIRFVSDAPAPAPGDWSNLWFEAPVDGRNHLTHVEIAHAGGWCSCTLTSCSPLDFYEAAVVIEGAPSGVFLEDSVIRDSAGHGVLRSWVDHEDLDFAEGNTFEGVAGCTQTWPELSTEVCPDTRFTCDD